MLILSVIHIPAVIINILAASSGTEYESTLAMTTLGNLGNAGDVDFITITGCDKDAYQFDACTISESFHKVVAGIQYGLSILIMIFSWQYRKEPFGTILCIY